MLLTATRRFSFSVLLFTLSVGLALAPVEGASAFRTSDSLPNQALALALETNGKWLEACRCYEDLIRKDRQRLDYREGYRRCLRRYHVARRHKDVSYRQALAKLTPTQALDLYRQVLGAVSEAYFDRSRAETAALFRNGVEELRLALREPAFVKAYFPQTAASALQAFHDELADWLERDVVSADDAREEVLALARLAVESGLAQRASALVPVFALEFACGGCNALDEYTLFVTPGRDGVAQAKTGPSVRHQMLLENFSTMVGDMQLAGLIAVSHFTDTTPHEINEALVDLQTKGARGAILDLRGNPGGSFKAAVQAAELFIDEGVIVHSQGQIKEFNRAFEARGGHTTRLPLLVLVDGETASAAEVLAGALKELGRARIIGQTTFGKGTVQAIIPLDRPPFDKTPAAIRLTVAKLLSPAKRPYTDRGVTPDIPVRLDEDALERAKAELRGLLNMMPTPTDG